MGACNDAVRPCGNKHVALLQKINSLPSGKDREEACRAYTAAIVDSINTTTGWRVEQVSNDSIYFKKTGDTMDIIKSSGGGNAELQCLLTAGPNFQPSGSSNGGGGGGGNVPDKIISGEYHEENALAWLDQYGMWLGIGGVALVAIYFIFKKMRG